MGRTRIDEKLGVVSAVLVVIIIVPFSTYLQFVVVLL